MRFLLPVTLIIIAGIGFFTFTSPLLEEVKVLRLDLASYNEALDNARDLKNERDKLTKEFNSFKREDLERVEILLPDSINNIRLILEIEELASPYGMVLRDVKYDTAREENPDEEMVVEAGSAGVIKPPKDYGVWSLEFGTEGKYTDFLNFLTDLESNLRLIDIASIQFSSATAIGPGGLPGVSPSSSNRYKYTFQIKTYWLKNVFTLEAKQ